MEGVRQALLRYLQDKRYLLTIDGLINFTNWDSLLQILPNNGRGSRAIIITPLKGKEVAFANPKVHLHNIRNLSQEDSAQLFCRKVFGDNYQFRDKVFDSRTSEPESLMVKVQTDIFEITEGLPLAIVVLAGLLQTRSIGDWDKVLKQLKSSNESERVERILALSYGDLPVHLKSCFLYFAGLPKNMIFSARRLVRLWAAEGFLRPDKKGQTMEDIGQSNLRELLSRRLIILVKKDLNGGVWLIAIHDRIHTFAESQAQESSFLVVHDSNIDIPAPASVRRLYLQNYMQSSVQSTSFPMLWSILCDFDEDRSCDLATAAVHSRRFCGGPLKNRASNSNDLRYNALSFLQRCKFLRVIDLRGLHIEVVPHAIGAMIHLRYLGLRSRFLTELPSSIARLTKLQTLNIKRTKVEKVAQAFWEIPTLRHVIANKLRLPKSSRVPLNNMQTLTGSVCSHPCGGGVNSLHNMVYLRYLEISGLTKQHWNGLADVFSKLGSLLELRLGGDDIPFILFTNFSLRLLQTLELYGRIDTSDVCTEDQCTLPNLTKLVLKLSMADQGLMNMVGELPSLMELVLSDESYAGEELVFSDGRFNSITIVAMAKLEQPLEWIIRPKSIPKITKIVLLGCYKVKIKLGVEQGLMEELNEVVVCNMPPENFSIEPADKAFNDKINFVAMPTKNVDIDDVLQRSGRWRAGMVAANMYHD